ncbi:MAG: hypothetical protein ACLQAH_05350 [Limisphaerales bacterium]
MKTRTPRVQIPNSTTEPDFDDEPGYYCDVFYPDLLPGEAETAYRLRVTFTSEGYSTKTILAAATHPVWVIQARRKDAPQIVDHRLLFRHIQNLLRRAGFHLREDELTIDRKGDSILVAFQWKDSPIDYAAGLRQAAQEAAEFAEMPL